MNSEVCITFVSCPPNVSQDQAEAQLKAKSEFRNSCLGQSHARISFNVHNLSQMEVIYDHKALKCAILSVQGF